MGLGKSTLVNVLAWQPIPYPHIDFIEFFGLLANRFARRFWCVMAPADAASMVDLDRNRQFSRRWDDPAGSSPLARQRLCADDPHTALGRALNDEFRGARS